MRRELPLLRRVARAALDAPHEFDHYFGSCEQSTLDSLVSLLFDRRFGWSEREAAIDAAASSVGLHNAANYLISPSQSAATEPGPAERKRATIVLLDIVLGCAARSPAAVDEPGLLASARFPRSRPPRPPCAPRSAVKQQNFSSRILSALESCVASTDKAVVRQQLFVFLYDWARGRVTAVEDPSDPAVARFRDLVIAGLTDVWSATRKVLSAAASASTSQHSVHHPSPSPPHPTAALRIQTPIPRPDAAPAPRSAPLRGPGELVLQV